MIRRSIAVIRGTESVIMASSGTRGRMNSGHHVTRAKCGVNNSEQLGGAGRCPLPNGHAGAAIRCLRLEGTTDVPPKLDHFRFWPFCEVALDAEYVRSSGQTGSEWPTVQTALLIQLRHWRWASVPRFAFRTTAALRSPRLPRGGS